MIITTFNVNGIRAACRKGFGEWFKSQQPDIVCLQEIRAEESEIPHEIVNPTNYHAHFFAAEKKGYSGVALLSKIKADNIQKGFQSPEFAEFDSEGRFLSARFGKLQVISLYLPSGSAGDYRQESKMRFLFAFLPYLKNAFETAQNKGESLIFCGDFNIAHNAIDLKNWKSNQKNSGFLPEERAWMSEVLKLGFVDVFRHLYPAETDCYTWWSNRGKARENNVGWRIDYQLATPDIAKTAQKAWVLREPRYSDHAPLSVFYNFA